MAAKQTKGNCYLCGLELGKVALKNHIMKAHNEEAGRLCHLLKIEGYSKNYWLLVEADIESELYEIDSLLRSVWLECCGHLSAFNIPWIKNDWMDFSDNMDLKLKEFAIGAKFTHDYDFGSTTRTHITVVDSVYRDRKINGVRLLARNVPLEHNCAECGEPADYLCEHCAWSWDWDREEEPFYCEACSDKHGEDEYMMPITNSPRMGVCGYDGGSDRFVFNIGKFQ